MKKIVKIVIEGGVVQSVDCPIGVSVTIHDYDTDGSSDFVTTDEDGRQYIESIWQNEN